MQQDRNKSRRPSSSIQQNSARRQGKPRKAYDWTQGYQEQTGRNARTLSVDDSLDRIADALMKLVKTP